MGFPRTFSSLTFLFLAVTSIVQARELTFRERVAARREVFLEADRLLDGAARAAVEAVSQWTYEPAMLEGKPVMVFFLVTVEFYLSS